MWFLADRVARDMRARMSMGLAVTAESQAKFAAEVTSAARDGKPRNYQVAGDVAEIQVEGLLTEKPDFFAWLMGYGNTTYSDIRQSVAMAELDSSVKRIHFAVNSPGGTVAGLFDAVAAITDAKKPKAVTTSFAASAAYTIAAVAGKITATNAATEVGSVGVAIEFFVSDKILQIANTESPNKRPDMSTEEGKAVVRQELDALFDILVESIAWGRQTTVKDVTENFGRGGLFVAGEAKRRGMIDRIARPMLRAVGRRASDDGVPLVVSDDGIVHEGDVVVATPDAPAACPAAGEPVVAAVATPEPPAEPAADGGEQVAEKPMDIKTLEKEHPELFAAVLKQGADTERDRVTAHIQMGEASGDMQTATESIKSGAIMTQTLLAKYAAAGMRKNAVDARQTATDATKTQTDQSAASPKVKDLGDLVADALEAGLKK